MIKFSLNFVMVHRDGGGSIRESKHVKHVFRTYFGSVRLFENTQKMSKFPKNRKK